MKSPRQTRTVPPRIGGVLGRQCAASSYLSADSPDNLSGHRAQDVSGAVEVVIVGSAGVTPAAAAPESGTR